MSEVSINIIAHSFIGPEENHETTLDLSGILRNPKNLKFMAKQDKLSVLAVHKLLEAHPLSKDDLNNKTGIYFCVGALPFEEQELNKLARLSENNGKFDIEKFSNDTFNSINPLLTFKCLPNMSIFHVSNNFEIHQTYFITYPGQFQWAQAVKKAINDLKEEKIEYAIVGSAADQRNPLVKQYILKLGGSSDLELLDVAGAWLLTKKDIPHFAKIEDVKLQYKTIDYFNEFKLSNTNGSYFGPAFDYFNYQNWIQTEKTQNKSLLYNEGCYSYEIKLSRGDLT